MEEPDLIIGDDSLELDSYEIKEKIANGGFSKVFKAYDKKNHRNCALKIIDKKWIYDSNEKDHIINSIKEEIKNTKLCKSENIIELYDSFETKKSFVIALELCDYDLRKFVNNFKDKSTLMDPSQIQNICKGLRNAMISLYQNKIIHRDIKPENIYLKIEKDNVIPKLGDFGISISYKDEDLMNDPEQVGTMHYMAPEVVSGDKFNYKIDLYSLGCVIYNMVFPSEYYYDKLVEDVKIGKDDILFYGEDLSNLLKDLLETNPEKRISMEDFINHPFFKDNIGNIKNEKKPAKSKVNLKLKDEKKQLNYNLVKCSEKMVSIIDIPNSKKDNLAKTANILYYDENIEKHLEEIHEDSDYFERNTPGAFILCSNIISLNLVMEEIKYYNSKMDKRVIFHLIVTGSKYEKVMNNLIKYKYDHLFQNICIYCFNIKKYSYISKENKKVKGIYDDPKNVVKFIKDYSSNEIKDYPLRKIISYNDYKDKYYERHEKISEFYGDLTKKTYKLNSKKIEKVINSKDENELRIKKKELIESLKTFDLKEDMKNLYQIIHEYTKNTFYSSLNLWLRTFDDLAYEVIAYYTARLMYALNIYGAETKSFFTKNKILYRGESVKYINILPYERAKGKIILFSAFTSTSEDLSVAEDFSKRKKSIEIFKQQKKYSLIYKINNHIKKNCVPCGVDIHKISEFEEKEILYQPFSFYFVKNTKFDHNQYTADIDLELIPRIEILEEKIRKGGKIVYNKENNVMVIEGEQIGNLVENNQTALNYHHANCKIC